MLKRDIMKLTIGELLASQVKDAPKVETKTAAPKAKKASVIEAAPKAKKNVVATLEIVPAQREGKDVLLFKVGTVYNHKWRGWLYANTKKIGAPSFKWDPASHAFVVEPERLDLLLTGIRATYGGSRLIMGEKVIELPTA